MKKATELFAKAGIDLSQARSTVINWPNQVVAVAWLSTGCCSW
jgi:hypothetical protein